MPPPRVGAVLAYDGEDSIYVFGGERSGIAYSDLYRYDESANAWEYVDVLSLSAEASYPEARSHAAGVSYGKHLFVFGGRTVKGSGSVTSALSDLWRFDMETQEWHSLDSLATVASPKLQDTFLSGVYGHTAVRVGTKVYFFGGYCPSLGRTINDVMVLDLETYDLHHMDDLLPPGTIAANPQRRMFHTAVPHPTEPLLYVSSGYDEFSNEFIDVWVLNTAELKWSVLTDKRAKAIGANGGLYMAASVSCDGAFMVTYGGQGFGSLYSVFQGLPLYDAPPAPGTL